MLKLKNGDLVHVPSSATLTLKNGSYDASFMRLLEPKKLLVTEAPGKGNRVGVLYDGVVWYVDKKDVYSLGEEDE